MAACLKHSGERRHRSSAYSDEVVVHFFNAEIAEDAEIGNSVYVLLTAFCSVSDQKISAVSAVSAFKLG
jgi:hypothetical protein